MQHSLTPSQFTRRHTALSQKSLAVSSEHALRAPTPSTPMTSLSWVLRPTKEHAWGIFRLASPSARQQRNICPRGTIKMFKENFSFEGCDAVYAGSTLIVESVSETFIHFYQTSRRHIPEGIKF